MADQHVSGIYEVVLLAQSPENLAKQLKLGITTIHKWLRNGYVPNKYVIQLEKLYGVKKERLCNPKYLGSSLKKK